MLFLAGERTVDGGDEIWECGLVRFLMDWVCTVFSFFIDACVGMGMPLRGVKASSGSDPVEKEFWNGDWG